MKIFYVVVFLGSNINYYSKYPDIFYFLWTIQYHLLGCLLLNHKPKEDYWVFIFIIFSLFADLWWFLRILDLGFSYWGLQSFFIINEVTDSFSVLLRVICWNFDILGLSISWKVGNFYLLFQGLMSEQSAKLETCRCELLGLFHILWRFLLGSFLVCLLFSAGFGL